MKLLYFLFPFSLLIQHCTPHKTDMQGNIKTYKDSLQEIADTITKHTVRTTSSPKDSIQKVSDIMSPTCNDFCIEIVPKRIKKEDLKNNAEIAITFTNNTEERIITGDPFEIEKLTNNQWEKLKNDEFFYSIGYIIPVGEKATITMNSAFIRTIDTGTYRISKPYLYYTDKKTLYVSAEFTVY